MDLNHRKKEDGQEIISKDEQERLENSIQEERLPEFNEFGTALNDI